MKIILDIKDVERILKEKYPSIKDMVFSVETLEIKATIDESVISAVRKTPVRPTLNTPAPERSKTVEDLKKEGEARGNMAEGGKRNVGRVF